MKYPETPVKEIVEKIHGFTVKDPYRWLEDDSPQVKAWTAQQNKLAQSSLDKKLVSIFEKDLKASFNFKADQMPRRRGDLYFYAERRPRQDQFVLYVKKGLTGRGRELVNPNKLSGDTIVTLDYWAPSPKGRLLAYGISSSGDELSELKVMDVATGADIESVAPNASWADVEWLPDESGFFYTRFPDPGTVPAGEERLHNKVYFHKLGASSDRMVFGQGRNKEEMLGLELSHDGAKLVISAQRDWVRNDLYIYDVKRRKLEDLITGLDGWFSVDLAEQKTFLYTNYGAPNGKILAAELPDLPKKLDEWNEVVPESDIKLEWMQPTADRLLLTYLTDAVQRTYVHDYSGRRLQELKIPKNASVLSVSASSREKEFFYEYVSYVSPGVITRYDPEKDAYEEYSRMGALIDPDDYEVKQEWFKSKDGTGVPMFIVHRKGLSKDGTNPTILGGYGGFEVSNIPRFLRAYTPWLERGGVYAVANIRGGGEFGKSWHKDGIRSKKQNSYDDFIAAAEHLINSKYTSPRHLGISGASNGGLLVNAVAVQRPDLFKAVDSGVPLADMVRFPHSLIASRWISEYGDPAVRDDLKNILSFSPYHNVKPNQEYPAFFFTTAEHDTRVHPFHARKMAALLQRVNQTNPVLIYTDLSSGHMGSLTMTNFYKNEAMTLAFFAKELGLKP